MSEKKGPPAENPETPEESEFEEEPEEEEVPETIEEEEEVPETIKEEEEAPKIIKKQKRKGTIITERREMFAGEDEEKLTKEITEFLKKARAAIAEQNYLEAVKDYQDASIAANMLGDPEREKIYLSRANEILEEHPELKEEGIAFFKKRRVKAKIREEKEKFSLLQMITNIIIAAIFIVLVYSGIFSAIILRELFQLGGSYSVTFLWGLCITIEITGLIIAYVLAKYWLVWPE